MRGKVVEEQRDAFHEVAQEVEFVTVVEKMGARKCVGNVVIGIALLLYYTIK